MKYFLFLVCLSLLGCASVPSPVSPPPASPVSSVVQSIERIVVDTLSQEQAKQKKLLSRSKIELKGVLIADVCRVVFSEVLKVSYIINPDVIALESRFDIVVNPVSGRQDVLAVLRQAFSTVGVKVEYVDGVVHVWRVSDKPLDLSVDSYVVNFHHVQHRKASTIVKNLDALLGKDRFKGSSIAFDDEVNLITFKTLKSDASLFRSTIDAFDSPVRQVALQIDVIESHLNHLNSTGLLSFLSLNIAGFDLAFGVGIDKNIPSAGARFSILKNADSFRSILGVLSENGLTRSLSSPFVIVSNASQSHFLVGDEVPVLSNTQYVDARSIQSVTYRETGLVLNVEAFLQSQSVDLILDVSSSSASSNKFSAIQSPQFSKRAIKSRVNVEYGAAVLLGGFYQYRGRSSVSGLPLAGRFSKWINANEESSEQIELLIYIKPVLVGL